MGGMPHTPVMFLGHGHNNNMGGSVGGSVGGGFGGGNMGVMYDESSQGGQQHAAAISGKAGRGRSLSGANNEVGQKTLHYQ